MRRDSHYLELMGIANAALMDDPGAFGRLVADTFTGRDGKLWDSVMDIFTQTWRSGPYDIYEAYGFRLIWELLASGGLYYRWVPVSSEPEKNLCKRENNIILSSLPRPFCAFFDPEVGPVPSDDGRLSWLEPIEVEGRDGTEDYDNPRRLTRMIDPGQAPLEVGYTELSVTFHHLRASRCLARWPYHLNRVILLVVTDNNWFQGIGLSGEEMTRVLTETRRSERPAGSENLAGR